MSTKNSRESFDACKRALKQIEALTRMKNSIQEMKRGYGRADPAKVPTVALTKFAPKVVVIERAAHHDSPIFPQGRRVNTDADAYVEILQTIIVKLWIDSVANGVRPPYVFQQDSAPSHKAVKTQDWMGGRELYLCHFTIRNPKLNRINETINSEQTFGKNYFHYDDTNISRTLVSPVNLKIVTWDATSVESRNCSSITN
ncbi:hypothetical protein ACTXT7_003508 [Hymenolepis weldensis]